MNSTSKPDNRPLNQQSSPWLTPRTKAALAGATATVSSMGIGFLMMPQPATPEQPQPLPPECSLPGGLWCTQPPVPQPILPTPIDYTPLYIGSMIMGLFTTAIYSWRDSCTKAKEDKHPLPATSNNHNKLSQEESKEIEKKNDGIKLNTKSSEEEEKESSSEKMDEQEEIQFIDEMLEKLSQDFSEGISWKTNPTETNLLEELSTKGDGKDLLDKCHNALNYLKKLEFPLSRIEKDIIKALTELLQKEISDTQVSKKEMDVNFAVQLCEILEVLTKLDLNSALVIANTCHKAPIWNESSDPSLVAVLDDKIKVIFEISASKEKEIQLNENETSQVEQKKISKKECLCIFDLYNKIFSYLETRKSLNDSQRLLVKSLATSIEMLVNPMETFMVTATNQMSFNPYVINSEEFRQKLKGILERFYEIDGNGADSAFFTLSVALIHWSKRDNTIGTCFVKDAKKSLILNFINKYKDNSITENECQAVVLLCAKDFALTFDDATFKDKIALMSFIKEKISSADSDSLPMLKSAFDLLAKLYSGKYIFEIAQLCVNVPGDAPEALKNQCNAIVQTILKRNDKVACDLILHCVKQTEGLDEEETRNHLLCFLESKKKMIQNKYAESDKKIKMKKENRLFSIDHKNIVEQIPFFPLFLTESAKIDNEIFQKCLLDVFKAIMEQEIAQSNSWNSPLMECVIGFLIHEKNFNLALPLLKVYSSAKSGMGMKQFVTRASEELLRESPKTTDELTNHFKDLKDPYFLGYMEQRASFWSKREEDDPPPSPRTLEANGIEEYKKIGLPSPY